MATAVGAKVKYRGLTYAVSDVWIDSNVGLETVEIFRRDANGDTGHKTLWTKHLDRS